MENKKGLTISGKSLKNITVTDRNKNVVALITNEGQLIAYNGYNIDFNVGED